MDWAVRPAAGCHRSTPRRYPSLHSFSLLPLTLLASTDVALAHEQAQAADRAALAAVRLGFGRHFRQLVPGKDADLRPAADVQSPICVGEWKTRERLTSGVQLDGLQFWVRNTGVDELDGVAAGPWHDSIEELSGGQRTLLGLAFAVAVSLHRRAPLYIMDEVDAALGPSHSNWGRCSGVPLTVGGSADEVNSARVARLVSSVFAASQVLVVSHHNGFHRVVRRLRLVRGGNAHDPRPRGRSTSPRRRATPRWLGLLIGPMTLRVRPRWNGVVVMERGLTTQRQGAGLSGVQSRPSHRRAGLTKQ
jgi:hypothetical protein